MHVRQMPISFNAFCQKCRSVKPSTLFTLILNHYHLIISTTFFVRSISIKYGQLLIDRYRNLACSDIAM